MAYICLKPENRVFLLFFLYRALHGLLLGLLGHSHEATCSSKTLPDFLSCSSPLPASLKLSRDPGQTSLLTQRHRQPLPRTWKISANLKDNPLFWTFTLAPLFSCFSRQTGERYIQYYQAKPLWRLQSFISCEELRFN